MKRMVSLVFALLLAQLSEGQTATWASAANGIWTNAASWQGGLPPGPGTDATINVSGSYTVTVQSVTSQVQNIFLGTTSSSGTQVLQMATSNPGLIFSNLTVGSAGLFSYNDNSFMIGTGLVEVASGGRILRAGGVANSGHFYEHNIIVDAGGRWTITNGAQQQINSYNQDVTYTINGTLDGGGAVHLADNTTHCWFGGTGQINVAQINFDGNNGYLYLSGALTINSMINQSNVNKATTVLTNGTFLTLNGPYYMQANGNMFNFFTNNDVATVTGTNIISIVHTYSTAGSSLGGFRTSGATGTLTIAGSGLLDVCQANVGAIPIGAPVLNLTRNAHFWGTMNTSGVITASSNLRLNLSGNTLTLDTNCFFALSANNATQCVLYVTNNATLAMRQATLEGNLQGSSTYNLIVGQNTPGTLALYAGTNIFSLYNVYYSTANLGVLLATNAVVTPDPNSVQRLQGCNFAVGMTNPASWGWKTQGAIEIYSNATIEAMNTDYGAKVRYENISFGINELRLTDPVGFNAMTVTVWNAGSPDNDQDGTNDTALYVKTLNITGLSGAGMVLTNGTGVAAGKARIYYKNLVGGTPAQLGTNVVQILPYGLVFTFH